MMARIETLSAYRCTFSYLQRNNPLKEELQEKIKADIPPEYTFADFIEDFCKATSSLAKGEVTERAIMLPEENVYSRPSESGVKKWRIVPYAGKQGKPFRIIKTTTGKKYDFGSDSAALYEHNIFVYQDEDSAILIFHRQSGSGCKSVFLEVANKMLRQKGIKLNMELYLPLVSPEDLDVIPTKIQLQFVRDSTSTDIAENTHKKKQREVVKELGLNLGSYENNAIKDILRSAQIGKIDRAVAFARIKAECPDAKDYNDAKIFFRVGKRICPVQWNEFDSIMGVYDITDRLHQRFRSSGDFIGELSAISDEYYKSIIKEEDVNAG